MSVARFWRETPRRYNLGASTCTECNTVFFPPRAVCPHCEVHRKSLAKVQPCQLSGEGEVIAHTVVHEGAAGFEMQVPYALALVRMVEGPILTAQIVDIEPRSVVNGMRVKAAFRKLKEEGPGGVIHYGYKFSPIVERAAPVSKP